MKSMGSLHIKCMISTPAGDFDEAGGEITCDYGAPVARSDKHGVTNDRLYQALFAAFQNPQLLTEDLQTRVDSLEGTAGHVFT